MVIGLAAVAIIADGRAPQQDDRPAQNNSETPPQLVDSQPSLPARMATTRHLPNRRQQPHEQRQHPCFSVSVSVIIVLTGHSRPTANRNQSRSTGNATRAYPKLAANIPDPFWETRQSITGVVTVSGKCQLE